MQPCMTTVPHVQSHQSGGFRHACNPREEASDLSRKQILPRAHPTFIASRTQIEQREHDSSSILVILN